MQTTRTEKPRGGWTFWAGWGAAFLGFPLGGLAGRALAGAVATPLDGALAGAATGAVIGAVQWLALRPRLTLTPWWIAATAAGMAAGLALGTALLGAETSGVALPLRGVLTGAAIGGAQWALLRRAAAGAAIWPPVVALGWGAGWAVTRAAGVDLTPQWSVFGSTGAWAFQLVTGLALAWLLRRRVASVAASERAA
jgi:hypothetical protein